MTATIGSSNGAAQTRWSDKVYTQHFDANMLAMLTQEGNGGNLSGVITKETFPEKSGTKVKYHFRGEMSLSTVKTGDQRIQGTGTDIARGLDEVEIDNVGDETQVRNLTLSEQRTKHKLQDEAGEALANQSGRYVASRVLTALTDTSAGRTQKRYVYGSSEDNWNATHATALGNIDDTDDKLTFDLLLGVKTKLITQSTGLGFMRPAKVMLKDGTSVNKFVGLIHPRSARDLKKSADYKTNVHNKDNPNYDIISGSNFIGEFEGILMYSMVPVDTETDKLLVTGAGANSIDVAHNLILGQGAAVVGYGKMLPPAGSTKYSMQKDSRMLLTTVDDDHGRNALFGWQMALGVKKLVDGTTNEDFGTFHLFTAAKAGL